MLVRTSPSGEVQAWFAGQFSGPSPFVTSRQSGTLYTAVASADGEAHVNGRTEDSILVGVLADEEVGQALVREEAHRVDHGVHRGGVTQRRHERPVALTMDEYIVVSTHGDQPERRGHAVVWLITRQRHDHRVLCREAW